MTKTCYLHIGSPKTGSTSIQAWFHRNREELERQGILYPGEDRRHNALLSKFHLNPTELRFHWNNGRKTPETVAAHDNARLTRMLAQIGSTSAPLTLISNENFIGHGKKIRCAELKAMLHQNFEQVKVVCYVRDPMKAVISKAQEQVKSGVRSYEDISRKPQLMPVESIRFYQEAFGANNVIVRNFDKIIEERGNVTEDLATFLAPDIDFSDFSERTFTNTSLTLESAMVFGALNKKFGVRAQTKKRFLRPSDIRNIGSTRFGLPRETILALRRPLLEQYAFLRDELGVDFAEPDFESLKGPVPNWDENTMEQIAIALNKLAGLREHSGKKKEK